MDLISKGIELRLIRFLVSVRLQRDSGWTQSYKALVDTGSPVSVIPKFIWDNAVFDIISPSKVDLYGIGPIPVKGFLSEVTLVFADEQNISPAMGTKAYLLEDDSIPFLIGIEGLLTDSKLVTDIPNKAAYLEIDS